MWAERARGGSPDDGKKNCGARHYERKDADHCTHDFEPILCANLPIHIVVRSYCSQSERDQRPPVVARTGRRGEL